MKLIKIHIDNFGGLHNYDYSFEEGLNVILHDNGWGKTTMAAFLKAMLYGFDSKRSKDITENERKRFSPWQGGDYGGYLDFEADGVIYRILRTFGDTPRFDKTKILELENKRAAKIPTDKIGESIFKLDVNAFKRSVFIDQNGLSISGAAGSIHSKLNSLVSNANDVAAYDDAIASLTQRIKHYEKTGARGELGDIIRALNALEQDRKRLESDIAKQDEARERISQIDILLDTIGRELEEKKKKLDEVSGDAKEKAVLTSRLDDITGQMSDLKGKLDDIVSQLGGSIPTAAEIDQVKTLKQTAESIEEQLSELHESSERLNEEYSHIMDNYSGNMPDPALIDDIRRIISEMQGASSVKESDTDTEEPPEGYIIINNAVKGSSAYIDELSLTLKKREAIDELSQKVESLNKDIEKEKEKWSAAKTRFGALRSETDRLRQELKDESRYDSQLLKPIIQDLVGLESQQRIAETKKGELSGLALTREKEDMILAAPIQLPDPEEGKAILGKTREIYSKRSELQGMLSRLDGEKSKADSLKTSLENINASKAIDVSPVDEPKKINTLPFIVAGTIAIIVGLIMCFALTPIMAVLSVLGIGLVIFGILESSKYKKKKIEYDNFLSFSEKNQETKKLKESVELQLDEVNKAVGILETQIANINTDIAKDCDEVTNWFGIWGNADAEISETTVIEVLEYYERIRKLRQTKQEETDKQRDISESLQMIAERYSEIEVSYPEITGKSISEAVSLLRSLETAHIIKQSNVSKKEEEIKLLLSEMNIDEGKFADAQSPMEYELTRQKDNAQTELDSIIDQVNMIFAGLGVRVFPENYSVIFRQVDDMFDKYSLYNEKLQERNRIKQNKTDHIESLRSILDKKMTLIEGCYDESEIGERLSKIDADIKTAEKIRDSLNNIRNKQEQLSGKQEETEERIKAFIAEHNNFAAGSGDVLSEIIIKVTTYSELDAASKELEKQRNGIVDSLASVKSSDSEEEAELRRLIDNSEKRRDELLVEYTQKSDFIRSADRSLERYPNIVNEIRQLYERKQKAQSTLIILKRTIMLISKAKENLADRYLSKVENTFNTYLQIWLDNEAVKGIIDIDFNVKIEENNKEHVAEGYSTGYCDLIDFCMRLALVDTLFEKEQPFLILDDPFVNLDSARLDKALELLSVLASNKQVLYFVCHPIRAVDVGEETDSRERFAEMAKKAEETIKARRTMISEKKPIVHKTPKEMYKISEPSIILPFIPVDCDYTITNAIFSIKLELNPSYHGIPKNETYELFFIDTIGHVLNDRKIVEITDGVLSCEKVQFCLNTRDDSGDQFELMVKTKDQDDYEVAARYPFKAKLSFVGAFDFF